MAVVGVGCCLRVSDDRPTSPERSLEFSSISERDGVVEEREWEGGRWKKRGREGGREGGGREGQSEVGSDKNRKEREGQR